MKTVAEVIKALEALPQDAATNFVDAQHEETDETKVVRCNEGHDHEVPANSGTVTIEVE